MSDRYKNMTKDPNVLVTGASGFIGGHIAKAAFDQGWEVTGLRRDPEKTGHIGDLPIHWHTGDLDNPDSLLKAMRGKDFVFHAAAYYPYGNQDWKVPQHVQYALRQIYNLIEAAQTAGVRRLIYTSSLSTIFDPHPEANELLDETDRYQSGILGKSAYHEVKIAMEQVVLDPLESDMGVIVLNPTAVFGPGDINMTMGQLIVAIAKGQGVIWIPGWINIVDVRDVADAHIAAALDGRDGERYIIGGTNLTIREAMTLTASLARVAPPRVKVPLWLVDALISVSDALPFIHLPSDHLRGIRYWRPFKISKAKSELGLQPRPCTETIQDSIDWYRSQGLLAR